MPLSFKGSELTHSACLRSFDPYRSMLLVEGTFCYENVVIHMMRMAFMFTVESYKLMPV